MIISYKYTIIVQLTIYKSVLDPEQTSIKK